MNILELGKCSLKDGKAGRLNSLYDKFEIASGFVIPHDVFLNFLTSNKIDIEDEKTIQKKILEGNLKQVDEIYDFFDKRGYDEVIVRSSASIEDGNEQSFAGRFDSFPRTTKDRLFMNIKKCWASFFEGNYRSFIKRGKLQVKFDVLIQKMIFTDVAGVAFSVDPVTGKEEPIIEAAVSCEDVVGGTITIEKILTKENEYSVKELLKSLKKIYKREIEIEFGFSDDKLYLFQVRPITALANPLIAHINSVNWCCFKDDDWTLFNRSLWIKGATSCKHVIVTNEVTEDVTVYYPQNQKQVRGFNGDEPPLSDEVISKHSANDIVKYISEYNESVVIIKKISRNIDKVLFDMDFSAFKRAVKDLIWENAKLEGYEYLINGLGQAFFATCDEEVRSVLESWKNDPENSYFPIYQKVFAFLVKHYALPMSGFELRTYVHVDEVLDLLDDAVTKDELLKRIRIRKERGFILANVHDRRYANKVLVDSDVIEATKRRFDGIRYPQQTSSSIVKGKATFKNGEVITGECVVLKNNDVHLNDLVLKNKILVCPVISSKNLRYVKDAKAIVVDHGGILSHAAIYSREISLPCLMGCEIATTMFETGNMLVVDINKECVYEKDL